MSLSLDELEAIRLADLEGLYQEEAAQRMGVSRATFGRILEEARRKVAEALVMGKGLEVQREIEGLEVPGFCLGGRHRHRFRGGRGAAVFGVCPHCGAPLKDENPERR